MIYCLPYHDECIHYFHIQIKFLRLSFDQFET